MAGEHTCVRSRSGLLIAQHNISLVVVLPKNRHASEHSRRSRPPSSVARPPTIVSLPPPSPDRTKRPDKVDEYWDPRYPSPQPLRSVRDWAAVRNNGFPWNAIPTRKPPDGWYWDANAPGNRLEIPDRARYTVGPRPWTDFRPLHIHNDLSQRPPDGWYVEEGKLFDRPPAGYIIQDRPPYHIYKPCGVTNKYYLPWFVKPVGIPPGYVRGNGLYGIVPRPPGSEAVA